MNIDAHGGSAVPQGTVSHATVLVAKVHIQPFLQALYAAKCKSGSQALTLKIGRLW